MRHLLLPILVSLAGSLPGCATAPASTPATAASAPREHEGASAAASAPAPVRVLASSARSSEKHDRAIARVGGEEIRLSDLGRFLLRYFREIANDGLQHLVDERILAAEAERLGVVFPPGLLDSEVSREVSAWARDLQTRAGGRLDLDAYLIESYGVRLEEHRRDFRELVRTQLLRDRVIRLHAMRREQVRLRIGVFRSREAAERAAEAVRAGADLARLTEVEGTGEDSAPPPFFSHSLTPPALADAVGELSPGDVSGPIPVEVEEETFWHVVRLVTREPGRDVEFREVREEIEAGLEAHPIEAFEYTRWAREMREAYKARVLR